MGGILGGRGGGSIEVPLLIMGGILGEGGVV